MLLPKHTLTQEEIAKLSSPYLDAGVKDESWEILSIEMDEKFLTAHIRMKSTYNSPTDTNGFHLSQLMAFTFLSQITVIVLHIFAGYKEKTRECWMRRSSISCIRPIRDPENIFIRMEIASIKKVKGQTLITTKSEIYDKNGSFKGIIKGLLSEI